MASHNIYKKCKSREVITSSNRVGVCVSYNEILRTRDNLARYTIAKSKNSHIPLHFINENFTFSAWDNFDHQEQSSAFGRFSNRNKVMTLFQVKPANVPTKPTKNEINLENIILYVPTKPARSEINLEKINLNKKLPCQPFTSTRSFTSIWHLFSWHDIKWWSYQRWTR